MKKYLLAIGLGLAFGLVLIVMDETSNGKSDEAEQPAAMAEDPAAAALAAKKAQVRSARHFCRIAIKRVLNNPNDVEWGDYRYGTIPSLDGNGVGEWTIYRDVRARNAFNAMMLSQFKCVAELRDDGNWHLISLIDTAYTDGDIVADFLSKHLPEFDPSGIERMKANINVTHSAEAMAILHDVATERRVWHADRHALSVEILKADRRLESPTRPKLNPAVIEMLNNWRAPDLFWLRDQHGITFSKIDYDALNENDVDVSVLRFDGIEDICNVNPDRKAELFRRAARRARVPETIRRLIYKY